MLASFPVLPTPTFVWCHSLTVHYIQVCTYLLKGSVDLLQEGWLLVLEEHPQLGSDVHVDRGEEVDG